MSSQQQKGEKKPSKLIPFRNSALPPLGAEQTAAASLAEAEHTEQVVSSEVMDPLWLSHSWATRRLFFMQMHWHSTRVAAVKITRSQEEWRRKGDGSWNTTPLTLPVCVTASQDAWKACEPRKKKTKTTKKKKNPDLLNSDGPRPEGRFSFAGLVSCSLNELGWLRLHFPAPARPVTAKGQEVKRVRGPPAGQRPNSALHQAWWAED